MTNAARRVFDVRFALLVSLNLIAIGGVGALWQKDHGSLKVAPFLERERAIAARLQGVGLRREAASYYEDLLKGLPNGPDRARLAFTAGELAEKEGQFERALALYFESEASEPPPETKAEAARRIVAILETLGKASMAKQALAESTTLGGPKSQAKGNVVVAKIGTTDLYLADVQAALDQLPPEMRKDVEKPEARQEFLKRYVAEEVLRQKADRLGIGDKAEFVKKLTQIKRQMLVQQIIEDEVLNKVTVDDADVKNHFTANKEKYVTKEKPSPNFEDVRPLVTRDYRQIKSHAMYQKVLEQSLASDDVKLFPEMWR